MTETYIEIARDGRDVRISILPRRIDMPSSWQRDPAKAVAYAEHLSRERGWPIRDLREAARG